MNISFTKPRISLLAVILIVYCSIGVFYVSSRNIIIKNREVFDIPVNMLAVGVEAPSSPYVGMYKFTQDWFTGHIPVWDEALKDFKGKPNIQYLEVGVFEGRAAVWMLENILTNPSSHLTGLDLFEGDYGDMYPDFAKRYFSNIEASGFEKKVTTIKGYSQLELRKLPLDFYDIIYIDGSHVNKDVLEDAIIAMRLLKEGGVLIFDDYARRDLSYSDPRFGIQTFFKFYGESFDVLHNDHQLFLKKNTQ